MKSVPPIVRNLPEPPVGYRRSEIDYRFYRHTECGSVVEPKAVKDHDYWHGLLRAR